MATGIVNNIKNFISEIEYAIFEQGIYKGKIKVHSVDETIDELINTEKSLIRFGDGEINIVAGKRAAFQNADELLQKSLRDLLLYEDDNLMITVNGIFDGMNELTPRGRIFWVRFLHSGRKTYHACMNTKKTYYNTFFTRPYFAFADKQKSAGWFERIKKIWSGRKLLVIEGITGHNGVGNDLFDTALEVHRIIGPPRDAFKCFDRILAAAKDYDREHLVLLSLGPTAKLLGKALYEDGYRVIDIGNLDVEYEWCIRRADDKMDLEKHGIVTKEDNIRAGFTDYLDQIDVRISPDESTS